VLLMGATNGTTGTTQRKNKIDQFSLPFSNNFLEANGERVAVPKA
jgi:hypothetical protein